MPNKAQRKQKRIGNIQYNWTACPMCQQERWVQRGRTDRLCRRCSVRGKRGGNWKRGWSKLPSGYITLCILPDNPLFGMSTNGDIYAHRYAMANYLGRCLQSDEFVHHLNGIRDDNRIENLALVNAKNHERGTLVKRLQQRIKQLEEELNQDG